MNKATMKPSVRKKIRIAMIEKELTGSEIARRIGVHRTSINRIINGKRKSLRIRKALANALDLKEADLWPEETESK